MTLPELIPLAAAGGVGALVRFLAGELARRRPVRATLAVNLVASLAAGVATRALVGDPALSAIVVTGFCGGLSTYSAFAVQVAGQAEGRRSGSAVRTVLATVVGTAVAAALGMLLGALLAPAVAA